MRIASLCFCSLTLLSPLLSEEEITPSSLANLGGVEANLQEPTFSEEGLSTTKGGIVTAPGIRIQAQKIQYVNKTEDGKKIQKIVAEDYLLFEYKGRFFVGSKLEYNFVTRTGTLWNGKTSEGIWFIGGDKVSLEEDGTYSIDGAFVTTSESAENTWDLSAKSVKVVDKSLLSAQDVRFNLLHVPCFWVPAFKSNLSMVANPPIRYKVIWDKGLGPRATLRYRVFSWKELSVFLRFDYRLSLGPGGAIETEFFSKDKRTTFITKSYGAYDKVVYDEHGLKRYRLQGLFEHTSLDEKTHTLATYDKFRDLKMIRDFPSSDFEVNTQKRTRLLINHQEDATFGTLTVEPRLNTFESTNQQLPLLKLGVRPFNFFNSGILSENYASGGYLDYVYSTDLLEKYPVLQRTHSARLETRNRIYRPFSAGPLHFTPSVGVIGIFYNNNQQHSAIGQGTLTYEGTLKSPFFRNYKKYRHTVEPYCNYLGLTRPKAPLSNHYTFDINDGLYQINSLKVGVKNVISSTSFFAPNYLIDLYTYGFFGNTPYEKTFPKGYLSLTISRPSYYLSGKTCWNFEESTLDYLNFLSEFTINADAALAFEFRHRSRYDWRKADHENFLVDMARPISELVNSPLSDGRNTILARFQVRVSPKWTCHFSSHFGWGRGHEPSYSSFSADAVTLLSSKWQMKISYTHTTNDDKFSLQLQLAK
jgi:hypothetical protein